MAKENMKWENYGDSSSLGAKQSQTQDVKNITETDPANNVTSLTDLPNEILTKITDLLPMKDLFTLELVNKRLRNAILNIAWPKRATVDYESINYGINPEDQLKNSNQVSEKIVESILSRTNIKHLDLSHCFRYEKEFTHKICNQLHLAPQLIKLNLSGINLKKDSLKIIAASCPLLENASFIPCFPEEEVNFENGLKIFFKKCLKLKYLTPDSIEFSGKCFAYIPKEIKYLGLVGCCDIISKDAQS